ncbi:hypothetical protein BC829DRAFT_467952 [Chytridium lagenaria]|nr:hypothetical protein BC829DRAFT_467952 [Chytridium lagenaria]
MLGVMPHPSGSALVIALANALPTQSNARDTFSYLSGRQQDFTSADWRKLHTMKFVPVERGKKKDGSSDETWAEPTRVYIGSSQFPAMATFSRTLVLEVDKREKNQSEKDNTGDLQCTYGDNFGGKCTWVLALSGLQVKLPSQTRIEGQPKITLKARELQELIHERALLLTEFKLGR